ncbi:hypothetical protein [Bacillus chungangensis]|uniref:Phosphatidylserine/phosphatidylglycerophosphate/ cardiolipin synthase-like enzyme n=1 Tax=Bacillus chungangensis TaxID=587633 RepID=A0ABT9WT32_9BACI|nr:hypothetical protein [Bacillus chungangensis]MDQ0176455.1 phosphatidylserine/phosphatidylglycerophosphate/cardiolipin synthase-like enzyme [Bacillus chungangensis]
MLCANLKTNHSKLFITDDLTFIGSTNFSFGSNNNYEYGVIFNNKDIISELRMFYCSELLDQSEFTNVPECFDPFELLPRLLSVVKELSKIESMDKIISKKETIPELRFLT